MRFKEKTIFTVDKSKGIQYGRCINVCSGMVIEFGSDGYPEIPHARGIQKDRSAKMHRYSEEK